MGNDYLVVDPADGFPPTVRVARALCDRRFGVGADGVVFGAGQAGPGPLTVAIHNSDGSRCERSANGLRAYALHVGSECALIETGFGVTEVRVLDRESGLVAVDLGSPKFEQVEVPIRVEGRDLSVTVVDNGNPHAVVVLKDVSPSLAAQLGPVLANHPRFATRVNTEFVQVVDESTVKVEVWERGAGGVLASGSGGCAAAAAAHRLGLVGPRVEVRMRGGGIAVRIDSDGGVGMSGLVGKVMSGRYTAGW